MFFYGEEAGRNRKVHFKSNFLILVRQCTSPEELRNFWLPYVQWSRYHITVSQANTAFHAVLW